MLIRLNCSAPNAVRKVALTLANIMGIIAVRSSLPSCVNITPTTELPLYQPVTSVSRIESDSADRALLSEFSSSSDLKPLPVSNNISKNGCRERSVLFLSRAIIR